MVISSSAVKSAEGSARIDAADWVDELDDFCPVLFFLFLLQLWEETEMLVTMGAVTSLLRAELATPTTIDEKAYALNQYAETGKQPLRTKLLLKSGKKGA